MKEEKYNGIENQEDQQKNETQTSSVNFFGSVNKPEPKEPVVDMQQGDIKPYQPVEATPIKEPITEEAQIKTPTEAKPTDKEHMETSIFQNQKQEKETPVKEAPKQKKLKFQYEVKTKEGNKVKGYFDAYKKEDLEKYLINEGYEIIKIKTSNSITIGSSKLKYNDLAFVLTQLSTYLKAGIPLIDSVRILEKQATNVHQRKIFSNITYELVKGENFSRALVAQEKTFPILLINMVKTAEMTGDLSSTLDDMAEYYTTIDKTRKQVVSAMTYPIIIFIFAIAVSTFILLYIIPTFVQLFEENNATIPPLTRAVLNTSEFLTNNGLLLLGAIVVGIIVYSIIFKNVKPFRKVVQTIYMKIPVLGKITIYKEVGMFTKTFASLLNHNVFITDSMAILSQVSNNEVFSAIINRSLEYLTKGARISDAFKGEWAFPIVAYEMLVTGENTGRLPVMMEYVANYYNDLYSNMAKRINTFIEPLMIIFLAIIVGTVVLSVIVPMFSFYSQIK